MGFIWFNGDLLWFNGDFLWFNGDFPWFFHGSLRIFGAIQPSLAVLIHPDLWGVVERFSRRTALYHDHCPAPHVSWGVGGGGIDEVSSPQKKGSKKTRSSLGKASFKRAETLFGYKTKMVLLSRICFLKTNMFANGWRLAITDFVLVVFVGLG